MVKKKPIKVLFACEHNSARSQMAAAFLTDIAGDLFEVHSAGLHPETNINPLAIEVMREVGIDISKNNPRSLAEFYADRSDFDFFITVCDRVQAEHCTTLSGFSKVVQWDFADPSSLVGDWDEKIAATRRIRDEIKAAVQKFFVETF